VLAASLAQAREAKASVVVAKLDRHSWDDLEVSRGARSAQKTRLGTKDADLRTATTPVGRAALAVLREAPGIAFIVDEVAQLQRDLIDKGEALRWLVAQGFISKEPIVSGPGPFDISPAPVFNVEARLKSPPTTWRQLNNDPTILGARVWTDALAALMQDADGPLPVATR
jgi:hypothetical protein